MYAMVTFEALKLFSVKLAARERARSDTAIVPGDDHSSHDTSGRTKGVLLRSGQAKHKLKRCQIRINLSMARCGRLVKAYGTWQAASARQEEVEKAMREVNMKPGASSPSVFHRDDVDASGLVHGDDFIIVTPRWHVKEIEKHLRRKSEWRCRHLSREMMTESKVQYFEQNSDVETQRHRV